MQPGCKWIICLRNQIIWTGKKKEKTKLIKLCIIHYLLSSTSFSGQLSFLSAYSKVQDCAWAVTEHIIVMLAALTTFCYIFYMAERFFLILPSMRTLYLINRIVAKAVISRSIKYIYVTTQNKLWNTTYFSAPSARGKEYEMLNPYKTTGNL